MTFNKFLSSTQEEVTNKFIEEFYKEYLGIEDKCLHEFYYTSTNEDFWAVANKYLDKSEALPRGIFSPEGRSKDLESRGSEEKLNKMATELSEKERIILLQKVKSRKFKADHTGFKK
ncbi:hypothetical protein RhiirA5_383801 [Rhizophagus irregularis]|uniref:Uncharacterized protein n=1 Tax=Rhizophagus irregularis TaxID=588596 RepID=A0A2N0NVL3_9GLOM|nr:hypothetical protein RhiirA5_383801 [Rhizophagus irregularis]